MFNFLHPHKIISPIKLQIAQKDRRLNIWFSVFCFKGKDFNVSVYLIRYSEGIQLEGCRDLQFALKEQKKHQAAKCLKKY